MPIIEEEESGPNIDAIKSESLEESTSMIDEELVEVVKGAEEVDAIGLEEEEDFFASRAALTLFAYSQVRGR